MADGDKTTAVARQFAKDLFLENDEAVEAALQVSCLFIEKNGLTDDFAAFAAHGIAVEEEHHVLECEAGLGQDGPGEEYLCERVATLEKWLADARRDLAQARLHTQAAGPA